MEFSLFPVKNFSHTPYLSVISKIGNQGTIFSIKEDGSDFTILHSFCPDNSCLAGKKPHDGVIKGEDGKLYGMTRGGGTNDWGVLYRVGVDGKDFEVCFFFIGLVLFFSFFLFVYFYLYIYLFIYLFCVGFERV